MRDFFKPWRRKIGVVTLALACVMTGAWIRSTQFSDGVTFTTGTHEFIADSIDQSIETRFFYRPNYDSPGKRFEWNSTPVQDLEPEHGLYHHPTVVWQIHGLGIAIGNWPIVRKLGFFTKIVVVPYWSIVLPLTLLSAYLLLSKPRSVRKPEPAEPAEPDHA